MSSENLPSEEKPNAPASKSIWTIHAKTSSETYRLIIEIAKREERSVSFIVSKILEAYYEEKSKLKIV